MPLLRVDTSVADPLTVTAAATRDVTAAIADVVAGPAGAAAGSAVLAEALTRFAIDTAGVLEQLHQAAADMVTAIDTAITSYVAAERAAVTDLADATPPPVMIWGCVVRRDPP